MQAEPGVVWALVSDVTQIGRYSPETFEAEWLDGATGPAVGARFRGHVRRNGRWPVYWTTCRVSACEPDKVFEFEVLTGGQPLNTWRYDLEAREGGSTDVTESFRLAPSPSMRIYWALAGWLRGPANERGMRQTLERIKAEVESAPS